jgi:hypothetical protein
MHPVVRYKTKTSLLLNSLFSFHFPRHSSFELQLFNTNMVDTFRRLLYDVSKRLSKEEVIDLVYLCKVPQSAQTKIQDGKDLFKHLEETGVISEQRIHTLKKVLYLLRPKRQDLLDLVDRKFPEDDNRSNRSISICTTNTINTVKSDTSGYSYVANTKHMLSSQARQNTDGGDGAQPQKKYFIVDCYCIQFYGCSITKPFCCCYGMTILLLFLLLISVLFWFSGKPKTVHTYLNANEYRKDIGFIVVSVLSFLLIIVIFPYLIRKHGPKIFTWCNRKGRETRERRRSLRNERQLLRESQAVLSLSAQSSRNSAAKLKVDNYPSDQRTHENSVLDIEAQRPGNQIQSI